ncbi:hypothetical protein AB4037_28975 [Labrys sp. KB_33_2]
MDYIFLVLYSHKPLNKSHERTTPALRIEGQDIAGAANPPTGAV